MFFSPQNTLYVERRGLKLPHLFLKVLGNPEMQMYN